MKKIGITGGIATGKSTFLKLIKDLGFSVFSCDEVIKELYQKPAIQKEIIKIFGKEILKDVGILDKKKILEKILSKERLKKELEELLHPLVKKELLEFFKKGEEKREKIVFAEVPLLFEIGWEELFDEIWVITCSEEVQKQRISERKEVSDLLIKLAEKQLPLKEKEKRAHKIFSSEKTLEELKEELKKILREYLED